jgi:hypothetical protein
MLRRGLSCLSQDFIFLDPLGILPFGICELTINRWAGSMTLKFTYSVAVGDR